MKRKVLRENIRFFLDKKNMTISYLAQLSDMHYSVLKNIMTGVTENPDILTIVKIAKALEISIDDLLYKDFKNSERR